MKCPVCRTKNRDDAIFCQACRTPLIPVNPAQPAVPPIPAQNMSGPWYNVPPQTPPGQYGGAPVPMQQSMTPPPFPPPPVAVTPGNPMEAPPALQYFQEPVALQYPQEAGPAGAPGLPQQAWRDEVSPGNPPVMAAACAYNPLQSEPRMNASRRPTGNILYHEESIGGFLTYASKLLIIFTRIIFILAAVVCAGTLVATLYDYALYPVWAPGGILMVAAAISGILIFSFLAFLTPLFYSRLYALGVLINDTKEIRDALRGEKKS